MSQDNDQQTARVNIDADSWRRFRILALEADRSIADYLGQLVRDELRRSRRRGKQPGPGEEPGQTRSGTPGTKPKSSVRLADARILTEWPHRG